MSTASLGLSYLATPYSLYEAGFDQAFIDASKLAAKLMLAGVKVYSPIVHCHAIAMHGRINPLDHTIWLPFDQAMMDVAHTLIVAHMPGWEESFGVGEEIKEFRRARKPIYDLDPKTLMMTRRTDGNANYENLLTCYRTGQMSEVQLTEHLKDDGFAAFFGTHANEPRAVIAPSLNTTGGRLNQAGSSS